MHIYDGAPFYSMQDVEQLLYFVVGFSDDIGDILSRETHAEDVFLAKSKLQLDVFDYGGRSRCRQGENGHMRFDFPNVSYL